MKHFIVVLLLSAPVAAQTKSNIAFDVLDGKQNNSGPLLEARYAEVLKKRDGKLQSHDWWLWGLTAIDYDKDGDPDFLVTIHGPSHGLVLKNLFKETGKLEFANATIELGLEWQLPMAEGRRTIAWDFDGDGWLDFAGAGTPHFLNQGGKKFIPIGKKQPSSFHQQAIVDLNGDGFPDIFNSYGMNSLWNPKDKTFDSKPYESPYLAKLPDDLREFLATSKTKSGNRFLRVKFDDNYDLDGDGTNEVILAGYAGYGGDAFGRYLTQKDGKLVDATSTFGFLGEGTPILMKDLDGDGRLDVLTAGHTAGGFFRQTAKGKFEVQEGALTTMLRSRDPYLHRADPADFNRDGLVDLVVSKPRTGPKAIFANLGGGNFEPLHKIAGWDSDPVVVCDLNDDGLVDVAIGGPKDQVTLFVNRTKDPGHGCRLSLRMPAPNGFAVGTKVEVLRDGRPVWVENAPIDGTPIFLGLGANEKFDVRATFPGGKVVERKDVAARDRVEITP